MPSRLLLRQGKQIKKVGKELILLRYLTSKNASALLYIPLYERQTNTWNILNVLSLAT